MLKFACPRCKHVIAAAASAAGTIAACPHCRQPFRVPGTPPAAPAPRPRLEVPADLPRELVRPFLRFIRQTRPASASARVAIQECLARIDRRLSAQLREILHHPDFRRLEATWRGLHYLVNCVEPSALVQVGVLNVSQQDLARDFRRAGSFDLSSLFEEVVTNAFARTDGKPFGLLVGDYEFGREADDMALLETIAHIAAAAHVPFVAAAAPGMFGLERWPELANLPDLGNLFANAEYAAWQAFRASEYARYTALTMPRLLARLPYGAKARPATAIAFEEGAEDALWMSAAWAYAARVVSAFASSGWVARSCGIDSGGILEGLPASEALPEGAASAQSLLEAPVSSLLAEELARLGFLPLAYDKTRNVIAFLSAQSCQQPRRYASADAQTRAESAARLNALMCAARFAHYVLRMTRSRTGVSLPVADCERWLNDLLAMYVLADPQFASEEEQARRPLAAAHVEMRAVKGMPERYEIVAQITPRFQIDGPMGAIRLAMEISV